MYALLCVNAMSCQNKNCSLLCTHLELRTKENKRNWINCVLGSNLVLQRPIQNIDAHKIRDKNEETRQRQQNDQMQ